MDRGYHNKNIMANLGFKLIKNTKPDYTIIHNHKRYHKNTFTEKVLKELHHDNYSDSLSLHENLKNNRYFRMYDSGKRVLIWKK
jgi:hypothetical protein